MTCEFINLVGTARAHEPFDDAVGALRIALAAGAAVGTTRSGCPLGSPYADEHRQLVFADNRVVSAEHEAASP